MSVTTRKRSTAASANGTQEATPEPSSAALVPAESAIPEPTDSIVTLQSFLSDFSDTVGKTLAAGNEDLVSRFATLLGGSQQAIISEVFTAIIDYRNLQVEMAESLARTERDRAIYEARIDTLERKIELHPHELTLTLSRRDNEHLLELQRLGREHTAEIDRISREHSHEIERVGREHEATLTRVTTERDEARAEAHQLKEQVAGIPAIAERLEAVESRGIFGRKKKPR